jgi:hypothetical protein
MKIETKMNRRTLDVFRGLFYNTRAYGYSNQTAGFNGDCDGNGIYECCQIGVTDDKEYDRFRQI